MKQEQRSLIAVALSVGVFLLWYTFFSPKKPVQQPAPVATEQPATTQSATAQTQPTVPLTSVAKTNQIPDPQENVPVKVTTIENDLYKVVLSSEGGVPTSWEMKKYRKNGNGQSGNVDLISDNTYPLEETIPGVPEKAKYNVVEASDSTVTFGWKSRELEVTKKYSFDKTNYTATLSVSVKNLTKNAIEDRSQIEWAKVLPKAENKGILGFLKGPANEYKPIYYINNKLGSDPVMSKEGNLLWAGVEDRYFISAIAPRGQGDISKISATSTTDANGLRKIETKIEPTPLTIVSGSAVTREYTIYAGPKDMENLNKAGVSLEKAIDYGWFGFIAVPILYLLKFFYNLIHNYGVAIILLTVFVKLLLNPLSKHSMKSMKAMQHLQPKMKELKEKYKNDRERLNMETMQLFRAHKVNPMGGCLPMLIQLPIYIALYKVLWNSIELYRAPFFGFYKDLSAPDPYLIMPIILGVAMFLQQKMTPSASADPAQAKMMQIMPIMFTAFMLFLPSGLVLYILVNTVAGVAQQWMMNNDLTWKHVLTGKFRK